MGCINNGVCGMYRINELLMSYSYRCAYDVHTFAFKSG